MILTAFAKEDYPLLLRWIDSPALNVLWGGPTYRFPLTAEQIAAHCAQPQVHPWVLQVDGAAAGFIELVEVEPHHCRLCRVFIAPDQRGKGLAKPMLQLAMRHAEQTLACTRFTLAVFEHNTAAIASYQSLGFTITSREPASMTVAGECWDLLRMTRSL